MKTKKKFKSNDEMMRLLAKETGLEYDNNGDDRLFAKNEQFINVSAQRMTKKEYSKMETELNKKVIKGKGYVVYAWNDMSGYEYWNKGSDFNYIIVTVEIQDMNKINPTKLQDDVTSLYNFFSKYDNIEDFYNYGRIG